MSAIWSSRRFDRSLKHLAGHQFVIGRIVTGIRSISLSGHRPQANIIRVWKRVEHRDRTKLASGMFETEEQRVAYLYRSEYDCHRNGDRLLDSKLFHEESYTTLNTNRCVPRTLVSRSSIAPSPGDSLLVSRSFSQSFLYQESTSFRNRRDSCCLPVRAKKVNSSSQRL